MESSSSPTPGPATGSARRSAVAIPTAAARVNRNKLANQAAQSGPGSIDGVLHDQLGGLLPGASVSLTDTGTGASYQTLTDRNGAFIFRALPPSNYELVIECPGFATVKTIVTVRPGDGVQLRFAVPIGSLIETVSVTPERGAAGAGSPPQNQSVRPRSAPQLPPAQGAIPFSGAIGGQIRPPRKLLHVKPIYPAAQQAAGIAGVVVLVGRVGIDGYIVDLQPRDPQSRVDPALTAAAIEAARQWEFTPTLLNGVPVEANITINVQFGLP
jgi:TonB family protein